MYEEMRPPIDRAMRTLDRAFFKKRIPISAARITSNNLISKCRGELEKSKDMLMMERMSTVRADPEAASSGKCILLKPEIKFNGGSSLLRPR